MSQGAIFPASRKQKLNTTSSTAAELEGANNMSNITLWTIIFMEAQGIPIKSNILYQDNKSAILLEKNEKISSSRSKRALNIRYFGITDQVEKDIQSIRICPTGDMIADFESKPLQGRLFTKFKRTIKGMDPIKQKDVKFFCLFYTSK
jgi:hypothetical protein